MPNYRLLCGFNVLFLCRADFSRSRFSQVLVFDVVNATTIQGLGIRPTDSFASLLLSILTLLLLSSGCPVVSCAVLRYLDRPPPHCYNWHTTIPGLFVPLHFHSRERKDHRENFRSRETFVPRERRFQELSFL